jgi:tripartite-type tricarboxylate transporter receptor subunit TctC
MIERLLAVAALILAPLAGGAHAQTYPNRPITMVVPFAAGGPTDIVARVIGERLTSSLKQTVVVENVAGAAGTTGAGRVARAPADGYTLLMGPMSTMSFSLAYFPNLPFHPLRDFEPVGIVASAPIVLVARTQTPGSTLAAFAAHLRANAGKMANGNAGVGSTSHLACVLLNTQIGVSPTIVPYRGTAPAIQDMLSGQIDYLCDQVTSVMGQITAGTIKPLAVLAPTRSPVLPNVQTASEAGFRGVDMVVWNAIFAPKGTPREVVMALNGAIGRGVDEPAARERFQQLGAEAPPADQRSPEALARILAQDIDKWGAVIKNANITLN